MKGASWRFRTLPARRYGGDAVSAEPLAILYVGVRDGTSLQRARTLADLGHRVVHLPSGLSPANSWRYQVQRVLRRLYGRDGMRPYPDVEGANRAVRRAARRQRFDVLWVDKGLAIAPATLEAVRKHSPGAVLLSFSLDDMMNVQNQSRRYLASIPHYDLHVTNKSYNVHELSELGAKAVLFLDNAFDPKTHHPLELSEAERRRYAAGVGFVGYWERDRSELILGLCREGIEVCVHGPRWSNLRDADPRLQVGEPFLRDLDYTRAINATAINLGFLRKANRDLQTTRSIEIPACGAFLLASGRTSTGVCSRKDERRSSSPPSMSCSRSAVTTLLTRKSVGAWPRPGGGAVSRGATTMRVASSRCCPRSFASAPRGARRAAARDLRGGERTVGSSVSRSRETGREAYASALGGPEVVERLGGRSPKRSTHGAHVEATRSLAQSGISSR